MKPIAEALEEVLELYKSHQENEEDSFYFREYKEAFESAKASLIARMEKAEEVNKRYKDFLETMVELGTLNQEALDLLTPPSKGE